MLYGERAWKAKGRWKMRDGVIEGSKHEHAFGVEHRHTGKVLAGQKWKDKWRGGVGYSNRNIFIIRRDGSGTVVPIRDPDRFGCRLPKRTDCNLAGCL